MKERIKTPWPEIHDSLYTESEVLCYEVIGINRKLGLMRIENYNGSFHNLYDVEIKDFYYDEINGVWCHIKNRKNSEEKRRQKEEKQGWIFL